MSDILETEFNAVIVQQRRLLINLQNSMVFEFLSKMLQAVYQSDLNKLCQSNIKGYNGII